MTQSKKIKALKKGRKEHRIEVIRRTESIDRVRAKKRQKQDFDPDPVWFDMLTDLRQSVDLINQRPDISFNGNVYKGIEKANIQVVQKDGWAVGYRLTDHKTYILREVFLKNTDEKLINVSEFERTKMLATVLEVLMDAGISPIQGPFSTGEHGLRFEQRFIPWVLTEKQPGLRVPNDPKSRLII